jgi:hypothetical protein
MCSLGSDPFLMPTGRSGHIQLSPTASSFIPVGAAGGFMNSNINRSVAPAISEMGYLAANSEPDTQTLGNGNVKYSDQSMSDFGPIGMSNIIKEGVSSSINLGQFDYDRRSRAFVIEDVPTNLSHLALAGFFSVSLY